MGEVVRYMKNWRLAIGDWRFDSGFGLLNLQSSIANHQFLSASGHRREEGDLVAFLEDGSRLGVRAIDRGRGHGGKAGEEGDLPGEHSPELGHRRMVWDLAKLLVPSRGFPKGGEIENPDSHRSSLCGLAKHRGPALTVD
jgi:hypothetical protein